MSTNTRVEIWNITSMKMIAKNNFQLFKLEVGYVKRLLRIFGKNINLVRDNRVYPSL